MSGQEPIAIVRLNRPCNELDVKSVPSPFAVVLFTVLPVKIVCLEKVNKLPECHIWRYYRQWLKDLLSAWPLKFSFSFLDFVLFIYFFLLLFLGRSLVEDVKTLSKNANQALRKLMNIYKRK